VPIPSARYLQMLTCCRSSLTLPGLCLLLLLQGCGQKTYEERLQRTVAFYSYLQEIEANLSPAWVRQDVGMSMRLPVPFRTPLPGPEFHKNQLEELVAGPDPRQQTPFGVPLPGMVEAWSATLDSGNAEPDTWIYILSNHARMADEADGGQPAREFITDLERELMNICQVTVPDGVTSQIKENQRYRMSAPPPGSPHERYTSGKEYSTIRFVPELPILDKELQVFLYERRAEDAQAALLVVCPKTATSQFRQRIEMALETWSVDPVQQKRRTGSAAGGTAPAPSTGTPSAPQPALPNF